MNDEICDLHYDPVERLKSCAVSNKITHTALKGLLGILSDSRCEVNSFHMLPKDPRTFLSTPAKSILRRVEPGLYFHFGIRKSLEHHFRKFGQNPTETVQVGINVDGLPLSESTFSQIYPILGYIYPPSECKHQLFLIGLYHGYEKPRNFNDFLSEFVDEAVELTNNDTVLFEQKFCFKIVMYLFDAVAKASVLFIKRSCWV